MHTPSSCRRAKNTSTFSPFFGLEPSREQHTRRGEANIIASHRRFAGWRMYIVFLPRRNRPPLSRPCAALRKHCRKGVEPFALHKPLALSVRGRSLFTHFILLFGSVMQLNQIVFKWSDDDYYCYLESLRPLRSAAIYQLHFIR